MKAGSLKVAVHTAVLAILIPAAAHASELQEKLPAASHAGELEEKLDFCTNCHGDHFQGFAAFFTAPRLAGQTVQYLENQFRGIRDRVRNDPTTQEFMYPILAHLDPHLQPGIAKYLSELNPPPGDGGPRHLVAGGRKIFEEGVPDENVPACAACHGPDAHGSEQVPRLAGQMYAYVVDQLVQWRKGYRAKDPANPSDENVMVPIAKGLTKNQIEAVAAYVSYQR